jgi:hypothetical protein
MPGVADDEDHLEGDEQHEEEGVRAESDENQKTIRPNLNRKQHAVTNSMKKKVFVLNQRKIKDNSS